jgi:hypothetical protein
VLFVDEAHRFNKAQQDAFLPPVESRVLIFIGATTENPGVIFQSRLQRIVKGDFSRASWSGLRSDTLHSSLARRSATGGSWCPITVDFDPLVLVQSHSVHIILNINILINKPARFFRYN